METAKGRSTLRRRGAIAPSGLQSRSAAIWRYGEGRPPWLTQPQAFTVQGNSHEPKKYRTASRLSARKQKMEPVDCGIDAYPVDDGPVDSLMRSRYRSSRSLR